MKVSIEIDCSDTDEIFSHLTVIRRQLRKAITYLEEAKPDEQWEPFTVDDENCYGSHTATVIDDVGPVFQKKS